MTTALPLYLVTACTTPEEFVAAFRRYTDRTGLFVPCATPLPAGRRGRIAVALRDGGVMLEGEAEVVASSAKPSVLHGRTGMTIRFVEPDEASKTLLGELERARIALKWQPPTVAPRAAEVPAEPRPVPPTPAGRIDAANALAESVAIGDPSSLRELSMPPLATLPATASAGDSGRMAAAGGSSPGLPKAAQKFVMPAIPAARTGSTTRPPPSKTDSPAMVPSLATPTEVLSLPTPTIAPMPKRTPTVDPAPATRANTSDPAAPTTALKPSVTSTQPAAVVPPPERPPANALRARAPSVAPAPAPHVEPAASVDPTGESPPVVADPTGESLPVSADATGESLPISADQRSAGDTLPPATVGASAESDATADDDDDDDDGAPMFGSEPDEVTDITDVPLPVVGRTTTEDRVAAEASETTETTEVPLPPSVSPVQAPPPVQAAPPPTAPTPPPPAARSSGLDLDALAATSGDWTITPDANEPVRLPPTKPMPSGPLTGDWIISTDSNADDGWSAPERVPKRAQTVLGSGIPFREVASGVANAAPHESRAEPAIDDGAPKVQIDPTLIESQLDSARIAAIARGPITPPQPIQAIRPPARAVPAAPTPAAPPPAALPIAPPSAIEPPLFVPPPPTAAPAAPVPAAAAGAAMVPIPAGLSPPPLVRPQVDTLDDESIPDFPRGKLRGGARSFDDELSTESPFAGYPRRPKPYEDSPNADAVPEPAPPAPRASSFADVDLSDADEPPPGPAPAGMPDTLPPSDTLPPQNVSRSERIQDTSRYGAAATVGGDPLRGMRALTAPVAPPAPPVGHYPPVPIPSTVPGMVAPVDPRATPMPFGPSLTPTPTPPPAAHAPPIRAASPPIAHTPVEAPLASAPMAVPMPTGYPPQRPSGFPQAAPARAASIADVTAPVAASNRRPLVIALVAAIAAIAIAVVVYLAALRSGGAHPDDHPTGSAGSGSAPGPSKVTAPSVIADAGTDSATAIALTPPPPPPVDAATAAVTLPADAAARTDVVVDAAPAIAINGSNDGSGSAAPDRCTIRAISAPAGAEVSIRNTNIGLTPISIPSDCGVAVKLVFRKPPLLAVAREVTPKPGADTQVRVALANKVFAIKVSSNPASAAITVNGKSVGATPTIVKVTGFEPTTIVLSKDGYETYTEKITPKENGQSIHAQLHRKH